MQCTNCKKDKPESEFRKNKNFTSRNGLSYQCKACDLNGKRTPEGHMEKIYHSLRYNNAQRSHGAVSFSKSEFIDWCKENSFSSLYGKWEKSGFVQALAPSVDRKNDVKPYTFTNMQLMTWKENHGANSTVMSKPVEQLQNGKVVKTHGSIREAGRAFTEKSTGSGILYALKKPERSAYGFQWRYKN